MIIVFLSIFIVFLSPPDRVRLVYLKGDKTYLEGFHNPGNRKMKMTFLNTP